MESAAGSLALASRHANVDAPRRHLGVFLLAHEVDLGRPDIRVPGELPHLGLAGGLPGDPRPLRPREPRPERGPFPPRRPPAGVEFRCPLGVAAAIGLNLRAVHGRSLRGRPHNTPPDGSAAAAAVLIRGSDPPGPCQGRDRNGPAVSRRTSPPPGGVGGRARMQVAPEAECPLGPPR